MPAMRASGLGSLVSLTAASVGDADAPTSKFVVGPLAERRRTTTELTTRADQFVEYARCVRGGRPVHSLPPPAIAVVAFSAVASTVRLGTDRKSNPPFRGAIKVPLGCNAKGCRGV
jgi:hypothetical protein